MAGFLDKKDTVIDMILTGYGRHKLSRGELSFKYWMPFDDEVDYDPFVATSGSMTANQLKDHKTSQIEATLVREATSGYRMFDRNCSDTTNVNLPLFTMPQGQRKLPRVNRDGIASSMTIKLIQTKKQEVQVIKDRYGDPAKTVGPYDSGVDRLNKTRSRVGLAYENGSFPMDYKTNGFLLKMFTSGSGGLVETKDRIDDLGRISYGADLVVEGTDD